MSRPVRQLRVVLNVDDLPAAEAFYRDALGLVPAEAYSGPDGARVTILDAGRATLELANPAQSAFIAEVENAGGASTPVRLAFEVDDTGVAVGDLVARTGAEPVAGPVRTPWASLNARVLGPEGLHVTLFQELAATGAADPEDVGARTAGTGSAGTGAAAAVAALVGTRADDQATLLRTLVGLAGRHAEAGFQPFTAVVVRDGVVVGAGVNPQDAATDPTAHAETLAVQDAVRRTGTTDLRGAVVLSSGEPCPVCRVVGLTQGVDAMVFAAPARFVPAAIGVPPAGLVEALDAVRPGWVRAGSAGLSEAELRAPYEVYLHHHRRG